MPRFFDDYDPDDDENRSSRKRNKPQRGQRIDWGADTGSTPPSGTWRQNAQGNLYKSTNEVNRGNR